MTFMPEKLLRVATLAGAAMAVFLQLALLAPQHVWWQSPGIVCAAVVAAAVFGLRGEISPELLDSEGAQRAHRLAALVPLLLLGVLSLFPTWGTWTPLWFLFVVTLFLLGYGFVPRARVATLSTLSVVALGLAVLDDVAVWCLAPVGLAWLLLPSLDRLAAVRLQLQAEVAPALIAALVSSLTVLAVGMGVFGLSCALLPPSTRDFVSADMLRTVKPATRTGPVEVPVAEILVLAVLVLFSVWFITRTLARGRGTATALEVPLEMQVGSGQAIDWTSVEAAVARWPDGARRDVVQGYLEHLRRLEQLGFARSVGETPAWLASRVGAALPSDVATLSRRLADAFGAARWSTAPVDNADVTTLKQARAAIEAALKAQAGK